MTKKPTPNATFTVLKPTLDGILGLYEKLTGRKTSPEDRARLALKYGDMLAKVREEPPEVTRH